MDFDRFGAASWDRWVFARALGARSYPEAPDDGNPRAAADQAFFAGDFAAAATAYGDLADEHPENRDLHRRLLHCLDATCNWRAREPVAAALRSALARDADLGGVEPLCYLSIHHTEKQGIAMATARNHRFRPDRRPLPAPTGRKVNGKIRVGYLSVDFRAHTCGIPLWPVMAGQDRAAFSVFAYSFAPDETRDTVAATVSPACDAYRFLGDTTWNQAVGTIMNDKLDLLIDTTRNIRGAPTPLFHQRLAPIQISAWGYGGSAGIPTMDHILSDDHMITDEEAATYPEALLRLSAYLPLYAPQVPAAAGDRRAAGLPDRGPVFAGFTNPYKLDAALFDCWLDILAAVPNAVLWMMAGTATARANLRSHAANQHIDPGRLVFAPVVDHADHLARFRLIDLVLDNPRLGSSAAAVEGLCAGVPAITLKGDGPAARGVEGLLRTLGLADFIAPDRAAYRRLVQEIATASGRDRARLKVRAALAADHPARPDAFVRAIDTCFQSLAAA